MVFSRCRRQISWLKPKILTRIGPVSAGQSPLSAQRLCLKYKLSLQSSDRHRTFSRISFGFFCWSHWVCRSCDLSNFSWVNRRLILSGDQLEQRLEHPRLARRVWWVNRSLTVSSEKLTHVWHYFSLENVVSEDKRYKWNVLKGTLAIAAYLGGLRYCDVLKHVPVYLSHTLV